MEQQNQFQFVRPRKQAHYYNLINEVYGWNTYKSREPKEKLSITMKNINPQKKTNSINLQKKKLDDVEIDMSKIRNRKTSDCNHAKFQQQNSINYQLKRVKSQTFSIKNQVGNTQFTSNLNYKRKNANKKQICPLKISPFELKNKSLYFSRDKNHKSAIFQRKDVYLQIQSSQKSQQYTLDLQNFSNKPQNKQEVIRIIDQKISKLLQETKRCILQQSEEQNKDQIQQCKGEKDQLSSILSTKLDLLQDRILKMCKSAQFTQKQHPYLQEIVQK